MAVNTETLLGLEGELSKALGDYLEFDTTTNVTTNTSIISTTLRNYDGGNDDYFNEWWVYITEGNNIGVLRQVSDYATATGTITVRGANLSAESAAVTCTLHRYDRAKKIQSIQRAINEVYPALHRSVEDSTLITGNILPDASFEDWSSATALTWYSTVNATLSQHSTAGQFSNGKYAMKVTASADGGYAYISSTSYRRLLDLSGHTVNFYCRVYSEVANDASIKIYTLKKDGTPQTLTSTTAQSGQYWTTIKLENQALNDDLAVVGIHFIVGTDTKYVVFDDALLSGLEMHEWLLPTNFRDGHISSVRIQAGGHSTEPCYDNNPFATEHPGIELGFDELDYGTQRYLKIDQFLPSKYRLRLEGVMPLETVSADTDTVTIDSERLDVLMNRAEIIFYERYMRPVNLDDITRYNFAHGTARRNYKESLIRHRMKIPNEKIKGI